MEGGVSTFDVHRRRDDCSVGRGEGQRSEEIVPFSEGRVWELTRKPQPCGVIVLGAGDVVERFYTPELYQLWKVRGRTPEKFWALFCHRGEKPFERERFLERMALRCEQYSRERGQDFDPESWKQFAELVHHHSMDVTSEAHFRYLSAHIRELEARYGTGDRKLFVLALPHGLFQPVLSRLREAQLNADSAVMLEKPLGSSAAEIASTNREILATFPNPEQQYRLDHYCEKEGVQNILAVRFANRLFRGIWTPEHIARIEIVAAETVGVNGRAYSGALRDMLISHLVLVAGFLGMRRPKSESAKDLWTSVKEFLSSLSISEAIRGQYQEGTLGGKELPGFLDEEHHAHLKNSETLAGVRLRSSLWGETDFVLLSGKRCPRRDGRATIQFRAEESTDQSEEGSLYPGNEREGLVFHFNPISGVSFHLNSKRPGSRYRLEQAPMRLQRAPESARHERNAYGLALQHALLGLQYWFPPGDVMEAAARVFDELIERWEREPEADWCHYRTGTWPETLEATLGEIAHPTE